VGELALGKLDWVNLHWANLHWANLHWAKDGGPNRMYLFDFSESASGQKDIKETARFSLSQSFIWKGT